MGAYASEKRCGTWGLTSGGREAWHMSEKAEKR